MASSLEHFSALDANGQALSLEDALARYSSAFNAKEKQVAETGGRRAPRQARGIDGTQLVAWLKRVDEVSRDIPDKPGAKFYTTKYTGLLFKPFSEYNPPLRVKNGFGHVDGNKLKLNVEIKRKRTPEELEAWKKHCDDKKMKPDAKERGEKTVTEAGPLYTIKSGQEYVFEMKGKACKNTSNSTIGAGVAVLIQGVRVSQDLSGKNPFKKDGKTPWEPKLVCSNVMICETDEDINEAKLIEAVSRSSTLIDLSEANGYGWETSELDQEEDLPGQEIRGDALSLWKERMAKVPESERPLVKAPFAMDYKRSSLARGITPAMLLAEKAFYPVSVTMAKDSLIRTESDGTVLMTCQLNIDFQVVEGGDASRGVTAQPTKRAMATLSPRTYKDSKCTTHLLLGYGIVNPKVWANLGPLLMPACDALFECSVDLGGTVTLTTNDMTANPIIDGRPISGYHFAVRYYIEKLIPDLATGVLHIGLQINVKAARFLLKKSNLGKSDDYGALVPQDVRPDIASCPLNKQMDKRVLNAFLYPDSLETLKDTHQFYLVIDYPNAKWSNVENKMTKNNDWNVDAFSAVLTQLCRTCGNYYCYEAGHCKDPKSYDDFPKIEKEHDVEKFVVFAVSKKAIEEIRSRPVPTKEDDAREFKAALEKGRAEAARVKKTHEVPAGEEAEEQPAKRQKPDNEEEEETSPPAETKENSESSEDYI